MSEAGGWQSTIYDVDPDVAVEAADRLIDQAAEFVSAAEEYISAGG